MKPGQPTWEDLNAYVDGELSDERAAELAVALGRDPELAEQVAALHRLKGAAQGLVEQAPVDLHAGKAAAPVWLRSGLALAASLVVVLLVGALWTAFSPPPARHLVWAEQAWTAHRLWQGAGASAVRDQTAALRSAQHQLGPAAFVPDLRSAGLTLEHLGEGPRIDGMRSLHLGYSGVRGCRLSLFVLAGGLGLSEQLLDLSPAGHSTGETASGRQAVAWQAAGLSNLLLAEGMDPLRFTEIARRVFRASVEQRSFDAETRQALQRSREESQRCQV